MIQFDKVQGDVRVLDVKTNEEKTAVFGMVLGAAKDYKITTNSTSRATLQMDGSFLFIKENSTFALGPKISAQWKKKSKETSIKRIVGTIWGMLQSDESKNSYKKPGTNSVAGVRG